MPYDPKDRVTLTDITKRGEWYTANGITRDGKRAGVEIHAATWEKMNRPDAEALARRSVLGASQQEPRDAR